MGGRPDRHRLADGRAGHPGGLDRAEHDPARSGRLGRAARVDGQRLQPELRGVADHRRRARRPLRAPRLLLDRVGPVRRGVGGGCAGAQRRLADRGPGGPGGRRGTGADAGSGAPERRLPARAQRARRSACSARSPGSRSPSARSSAARSPRASTGRGSSGSTSRSAWPRSRSYSAGSRRASAATPDSTSRAWG